MEAISRSQDRLSPEYSEILFKRHLQGALVRSGASLIMGLFAVIAFYIGSIKPHHLAGVGFSILFLILINPPTLWILKKIKSRLVYRYFSLLINLLEIIGYTGIIYFLGGIEATYLTLIYAAIITYVGTVAPRSFPFIVAALCALAFSSIVILEYLGYLPHQHVVSGFRIPFAMQMIYVSVVMGLLFVTAYISAYTASTLKRTRDKLHRKNVELEASVRTMRRESSERKQAEEALRESEAQKAAILDGISTNLAFVNEDLEILWANKSSADSVNRNVDEIIGHKCYELWADPDAPCDDCPTAKAFQTKKTEQAITHPPDGRVWEEKGEPLFDEKGELIGVLEIAHDITAKARAEDALRESEEKYRTILENIEDGYFEVDSTGNLTFFNESLCRILGYPKDELMGMNNRQYMDAENSKKVYQVFKKIYATGIRSKEIDYEIIRKDGSKNYIAASVSLMQDAKDNPIGFRGIARDITESLQAKKHLERYQIIMEASPDPVTVYDPEGRVTYVNPAFEEAFGWSHKELINKRPDFVPSHEAEKTKQAVQRVLQGERVMLESQRLTKDKRLLDVLLSAVRFTDHEGHSEGMIVTARDITDRNRTQVLEQAKVDAEAANIAKSEFLANMSHEIRTPLNGIIGLGELAFDTNLDDEQKSLFYTINKEANSLLDIINEILDFSKIESGKFELEKIPFDFKHLIEDVANSFAYRAEQKGLRLASFLSSDVQPQLIGDPGRLRQVMVNLVGNALKFTSKGEIYIQGGLAEDLGDRVKIRVSIKDTGIGIPKDKQSKIFESFIQADGSTTREYGGTGLGTTISKQLTEMMGGEIGLDSEEGKGSTFWFTAVFAKQKKKKPVLAEKEFDLSNLKILVVDDNKTNRFILTEYLKAWRCQPVAVAGGKEALTVLRDSVSSKEPFELILTDFQMPKMSGFDLAREIRTVEILKGVPIIVLTSAGMQGDGKCCKEIGINGYLTKPIKQDDLRMAIVSVLGLSAGQDINIVPELVTAHTIAEESRKECQILLAEDYPTNQQVAMRHLNIAGYRVDLVENGQLAVEAFKSKSYDLILMDIQMPLMDGYEATNAIRNLENEFDEIGNKKDSIKLDRIPIIAMTAHAIEGYRDRCLEAGMDDYITKPLKRIEFLSMVDKWTQSITGSGLPIAELRSKIQGPKMKMNEEDTHKETNLPINFDKAVEEFEGDKEFLVEVLNAFLENVSAQTGTIRQAISDGDAEMVRREAHSIKGGSANLTADTLSDIAFKLERTGSSGDLERSLETLELFEKEFKRLEEFTKKINS